MEPTAAQGRAARAARLRELDALVAADARAIEPAFERAGLLDALGDSASARAAYLAVLARDSRHRGALNELGRLLDRTGFSSAARTLFTRAVEAHPDDAAGHGNLATSLIDAGDVEEARRHYEIAIALEPENAAAHQCLAILHLRSGDQQSAMRHGRIGFRGGATAWPYRGSSDGIAVLVLHSALGGNVPIDRFIDDVTFAKTTIVAEFFDPACTLPPHALVVNAIGDASRCRRALAAARRLLRASAAPVINAPERVARTTREANARAFAALPGVVAPRTLRFARARLSGPDAAAELAAAGFDWPLIVRAPGFQTGAHCALVEHPDALAAAVAALPGEELLAIEFIDVRDRGGRVRKCRVMIVGGAILPLHLAISEHWMVHYFRADRDVPDQLEEADFLRDMRGALGSAAVASLAAVGAWLGLDYGGIDFALDARGRVVVFEANATMIVPPSAREALPARRAAVEQIESAVRALLLERAARGLSDARDPSSGPPSAALR